LISAAIVLCDGQRLVTGTIIHTIRFTMQSVTKTILLSGFLEEAVSKKFSRGSTPRPRACRFLRRHHWIFSVRRRRIHGGVQPAREPQRRQRAMLQYTSRQLGWHFAFQQQRKDLCQTS
jgi:hypothetical protein